MSLEKTRTGCLVCLNSTDNILIPAKESQDIFNVCSLYVKNAINIEFLVKNINGNKNKLSFCKNCLDSSLNLGQLVEKLSKLKQEITDFTNSFSETIAKHRIQAEANENKKQLTHENKKFLQVIEQSENLNSSDDLSLPYESSNHLVNHHLNVVDENQSEIVKIESEEIIVSYVDESGTEIVTGYEEEEYDTNYLVAEDETEIDPNEQIEVKPTEGIVNDCIIVSESMPQMGTSKSFTELTPSELITSVTMPNIMLKRVREDVTSNEGVCFNSPKTDLQDEPGVNFKNLPSDSGPSSSNSMMNEETIVKPKKGKIKKRPYSCSICHKSFYSGFILKRHYSSHTGEKPFKCSVCDKSYVQASDLKIHERVHTGERPYKCSMCESSFSRITSLKYHERTHTGVTPFKCSYCDLKFKTNSSRCRHQQKYHPYMQTN